MADATLPLEGKTALVTGASRGIGAEVAVALAEAGAAVVCAATVEANARPTVERIAAAGGRAIAAGARVEDAAQVATLFDRAEAELGPVHVLVSNADIAQPKPLLEMDEATWDRVVDINLKGVFLCGQRAAQTMVAQGGGAIVNIGSIAGENAFPRRSPGAPTTAPPRPGCTI